MKHAIVLYIVTLAVMTLPDFLWIGVVARDFYKNRLGDLMEIHPLPAVIFYFMYVAGILIFASGGDGVTWRSALTHGALFGFFAYATYDLTNLATLRGWSLSLSLVDMLWGTCVTAFAAACGRYVTDFLLRS